jgi:hypothetical protein
MSKKTVTQPPIAPQKTVLPFPYATLESAKLALNNEFCFIERLPGIAVIPTPDDPELHVYSRGEFVQSVCSDRIVSGVNVANDWMKWTARKKVRNLTYAPGKPQIFSNLLNTWVPSKIRPKKGDLSYWNSYLDHIFQSDSTHRDWFISWLAYQFQHPGIKLHSACVFWSNETGTGKSLFGYLMAELFGPHNFSEINESELHGRFNFWAARKQFVMGEEIKGSNAQKANDFLKSVITRKFVTIDTKNTPHYTLPDCINYFFTSNRENAFSLDDTDRRFFVHRLSNKKLDADYVEHTLRPWLAESGYSAILHYLKHEVDLSAPLAASGKPFNPYGAAPQTAARKAMIEAGKDEVDIWLDEIVGQNSETFLNTGWKLATAEDLHDLFHTTYPGARIAYKAFVSKLRGTLPMVRGGNRVQVTDDGPAKRIYATPSGYRGYEKADSISLISSYSVGR